MSRLVWGSFLVCLFVFAFVCSNKYRYCLERGQQVQVTGSVNKKMKLAFRCTVRISQMSLLGHGAKSQRLPSCCRYGHLSACLAAPAYWGLRVCDRSAHTLDISLSGLVFWSVVVLNANQRIPREGEDQGERFLESPVTCPHGHH